MKQTVAAIGSAATILIPTFFYFKHSTLAVICVCIGISCVIVFAWLSTRDRNLEKKKSGPFRMTGVMTDGDTRLIIKAVSDETNGFVTLGDIVRDTNLPVKRINKTLDWLLMNNFAITRKARNGKVFILTPEGRSVFSQLINETINKPQT